MKAARGEVDGRVISAEPLSKNQLTAITKAMQGNLEKGQKIMLEQEVDKTILGGLQVQVGDRFIDMSVSTQINDLHRALL
jgi:F-type H+-transporting ATPase subunit O